ncbi:MAG TPA: hypothetical protein VM510_11610, partial [Caulifigura sp.]|nr:hypothetical protein [Caulifigura sp.]
MFAAISVLALSAGVQAAPPAPPTILTVADKPFDAGHSLVLQIEVDPAANIRSCIVEKSAERAGLYQAAKTIDVPPVPRQVLADLDRPGAVGAMTFDADIDDVVTGKPVWLRVRSINADGEKSPYVYATEAVVPTQQFFDGKRFWFFVVMAFVCGSVLA